MCVKDLRRDDVKYTCILTNTATTRRKEDA